MLLTAILLTTQAFAADLPKITLDVLPWAKVKTVNCEAVSNINHDEALAGSVVVTTNEGKEVKMSIVLSRFGEPLKESKVFCRELKEAAKSGKALDVIFQESTDNEGKTRLDIKGAVQLRGLNENFNG